MLNRCFRSRELSLEQALLISVSPTFSSKMKPFAHASMEA
jgi:hypothetical protein